MGFLVVGGPITLSLPGAATSTIFVATKVCLPRQNLQNYVCRDKTYACRDKHMFVATKHVFCRNKSMLVVTKMILVAAPANDNYVLHSFLGTIVSRDMYTPYITAFILQKSKSVL